MEPENADGRTEPRATGPGSPLGRGLQDVSHLFLSSPRATPPAERVAGDDLGAPQLLSGGPAPDRPGLVAFLRRHIEAVEPGLRAIDGGLPCEGAGEIDLLAVDSGHRLVAVDVETAPDDRLLLRGLAHADWMTRNAAILRRLYASEAVDLSLRPRLVLVAPQLSWLVRSAARQLGAPRITWCTYRAVALGNAIGLVLDAERNGG